MQNGGGIIAESVGSEISPEILGPIVIKRSDGCNKHRNVTVAQDAGQLYKK